MPSVCILNRAERRFFLAQSEKSNLDDIFPLAGLERGAVDFGTIAADYSIIVWEWSLIRGAPDAYWRLNTQLFNGNAILFKTDETGKTIDFPTLVCDHFNNCGSFEFFENPEEVETAIDAKRLIRPASRVNGTPIWKWNR